MATEDMKTRYIGFCPICEGDFRLHKGKLVHHGYKRPGTGYIEGDCIAVHRDPYEVSCEVVKEYRLGLQSGLDGLRARLEELKSGTVTHIRVTRLFRGNWMRLPEILYDDYSIGVTPEYVWSNVLQTRIRELQYEVLNYENEIKRCMRLIDGWAPKPIRTLEEDAAAKKAEVESRRLAREQVRQKMLAEKAARKAKSDALAAERKAIADGFRDKFIELAKNPEANREAALKLAHEMHKTKYRFIHTYELKCDDAFVALGLADRVQSSGALGGSYVRYRHPLV
jgi:hypothetical protein